MGVTEILEHMRERKKNRKELIQNLDERMRIEKLVHDRTKSSNQRELELFMKEENEENIKVQLDHMRKKRDEDIKFNHNPLNTKNIMKSDWEIMKEKNMFKDKGSMFVNQPLIHQNNPKLLQNSKWLMS